MGQSVQRGLEQPVLFDVLGELVKGHFNGQRYAETPLDLRIEPDAAPDGVQGLLLLAVSLQQASPDGLTDVVSEGRDDTFQYIGIRGQIEGVLPPMPGVEYVGNQEHHPVHRNLRPYHDGQTTNTHRANIRRGPQVPGLPLVRRRCHSDMGRGQGRQLLLIQREVNGGFLVFM